MLLCGLLGRLYRDIIEGYLFVCNLKFKSVSMESRLISVDLWFASSLRL